MAEFVVDQVRTGYRRTHESLLDVARKTDEASFQKPFGTANSIAFNFWHVARWDDSLFPSMAELIPELAETLGQPDQIWTRDSLAQRWQLPSELGGGAAGTGLPQDTAHGLVLPARDELIGYATRVFDEFAARAARLRTADLEHTIPPKNERTVGHWLLYYWEHAARHLGMIEALRGVFGESGSARG
ncbi:MAG TPA: DinB family protein [Candidatus Limnocylindrales bacterium]|nr:DinB family protein [Candidatus Limnocylindrales bacterium]